MRYNSRMKFVWLACLLIIGLLLISFNYIFVNRTIIIEGVVDNKGGDIGADQQYQVKGYGEMEIVINTTEGQMTILATLDKRLYQGKEIKCVNRYLRFVEKLFPKYKGFKFYCKDKNNLMVYL